jgi:hypothetical protein
MDELMKVWQGLNRKKNENVGWNAAHEKIE